jgi:DNA-binding MarR family transcriptional regulator
MQGSKPAKKLKNGNGAAANEAGVRFPVRYGPLTDYVGYALRRAQISTVTEFLGAMKGVDLRPTQFAVLTIIKENPGVRPTEVCCALGIQKANFVPLLDELQRRGFAVRRAGVPDRRSSALHLTSQGEAVLQRARSLHAVLEESLAVRLGPRGRDKLLDLLNRLIESDAPSKG